MKSLVPLSNHRWNIYVQVNQNNEIEYGLYRSFNSIKEHDFNTNLFLSEDLKAKTNSIFAFTIESFTASNISFKSLKGEQLDISFSLESKKTMDFNIYNSKL